MPLWVDLPFRFRQQLSAGRDRKLIELGEQMTEHFASVSLDLDNKWAYLRTHGSQRWQHYPSYLNLVIPIILDFLDRYGLSITFFVVGQDAAVQSNKACLLSLSDRGHDIANHSLNHEPWLHLLSEEQLDAEISGASEAIFSATKCEPSGFRGPGYSISALHLKILARHGYTYDASVFPNILNPLARVYFFSKSRLTAEERRQRSNLFGSASDALRPIDPFNWTLSDGRLMEIPVTTMPLFRLPFHFSYILYLSGYSEWIAMMYFRYALWLCRRTSTKPSLLLHPLDFLGREDESDLKFFPGMSLSRPRKLRVLGRCVDILRKSFRVVNMRQHAEILQSRGTSLRSIVPKFRA